MRNLCKRGLSIIEVQLSFLFMLIAVLALLGLMPAASRQGTTSASYSRALYAATQTMEERLRNNTYGDTGQETLPELAPSAVVRWSTSAGTNANTQMVRVEVTWLELNRPMRVELKSLIYR